jgi:hypothetical protein
VGVKTDIKALHMAIGSRPYVCGPNEYFCLRIETDSSFQNAVFKLNKQDDG